MDFENIEIGLLNENGTLPEKSAVLERFQEGLSARLKGEPAEEVSEPTLPESGGAGADDSEGQESTAESGAIDEVALTAAEASEVETAENENTVDEESDRGTDHGEEGVTGGEDQDLVLSEDEVDTPEEQHVEGELESPSASETGPAAGDADGSIAEGRSGGSEDEEVAEGVAESSAVDDNDPEAPEKTAEKDYSNEWTPEELAELGEDT